MTRRLLFLLFTALLVGAPAARASGVPAVADFVYSSRGVATPNGAERFLTRPERRTTVLRAITGGATTRSVRLAGIWAVPVVADDSSTSGLSHDARTLVLVRQRTRFPQRSTHLLVVDTRSLRVTARIALPGDFSVDAISPDAHWLYLIEYVGGSDPTRYRVRALDVRTHRLVARPIIDPRDREKMHGYPVTRAMSTDGRWAYTLYTGSSPFIHALDTAGLTARCIDVPRMPVSANPFTEQLRLDGNRLLVVNGNRVLASVDTRTFVVSPVPAVHPSHPAVVHRPHPAIARASSSGGTWAAVGIVAAFVLLGGVVLLARRRMPGFRGRAAVR